MVPVIASDAFLSFGRPKGTNNCWALSVGFPPVRAVNQITSFPYPLPPPFSSQSFTNLCFICRISSTNCKAGQQAVCVSSSFYKKKLSRSQKGVDFPLFSKACRFHCDNIRWIDGRSESCSVLGQRRCAGGVFLCEFSGVKPYKEGPAKEQMIAGVRVFTWNEEDPGLSPVPVRLVYVHPYLMLLMSAKNRISAEKLVDRAILYPCILKWLLFCWANRQMLVPSSELVACRWGCWIGMIGRCTNRIAGGIAGGACSLWRRISSYSLEK